MTVTDDPTIGATAGTRDPVARTIANLQAGLVFTIYNKGLGCAPHGGPLCTAATVVELDGTYTGTGTTAGDAYRLTGGDITDGLQPWLSCNGGPFLTGEAVGVDVEGRVI